MYITLKNCRYTIGINNGIISEFYSDTFGSVSNLSLRNGKSGTVCFTCLNDDITSMPHDLFTPYSDKTSVYDVMAQLDTSTVVSEDTSNGITTQIFLTEDGLNIKSSTENESISEFGINFELNFLGRKGSIFRNQLLPTSPYTSSDGKYMFFIMTNPENKFLIITAKTPCDGWKIDYSSQCFAHNILIVKFLASFDRAYKGSSRKNIELNLQTAQSIDEAFYIISKLYNLPVCRPILNGGFDNYGIVKTYGDYDYLNITSPSGKMYKSHSGNIEMTEFGFYTVTPVLGEQNGTDCILWNEKSMTKLFDKSCDAVKKPYHCDDNLCEGGCFLWAMLENMNFNHSLKYDKTAKEELGIITAKGEYIPRKTIIPHKTKDYGAYHIHNSTRVQEQFFGVSILLEAYKLYKNEEIYEYMIYTLLDLVQNYIKSGMVYNGKDYTTVCAPIIPVIDTYLLLKSKKDIRYKIFGQAADEMAKYLYTRQYNFPTEGNESDLFDDEYEDGSISCTALSLLYYCRYIKRNKDYENFAYDVLNMHRARTMYSPDAKMNGSSFRWWETIWEGDGEGPALCCGHAWTIWKGEALFHGGILSRNDSMLLDSWNSYITNFCKTQKDGTMYSCYEADYIRGGGDPDTKPYLKQLKGENLNIKYETAHSFPKHTDNSLSRYVWIRACHTWMKTAAILNIDGKIITINAKIENNIIKTNDNIKEIYISEPGLKVENEKLLIL